MKKVIVVLLLLSVVGAVFAGEEGAKFKPSFKPDMQLYFNYDFDTDADSNLFTLGRMYLGLKVKPTKDVTLRATTDIKYDGSLKNVYLKYAYAEIKNILPVLGMKFIFGQQKTGLIDFEQKIWGHRDVSKVGLDKYKIDDSADMGLVLDGKLPSKLGAFHLGFYGGEGYKGDTTEVDDYKAFSVRVNLTPFASSKGALEKLMLTGYFKMWGGATKVNTFGGILSLQNKMISVAAEYFIDSVDGGSAETLFSAYLTFHAILKKVDIFARLDLNDPSDGVDDNEITSIIAGVKYKIAKKSSIALAFNSSTEKTGASTEVNSKVFSFVFAQGF